MKPITFNYNKLLWVSVFAIAMAFIETAVVVYLRALYYPQGFQFPLVPIDFYLAITEIFREAATLIMLLSIGIFAGKNLASRFAYFIHAFAIWDIYYYVFLKLILGWPESLCTWDLLFLIPVAWVGPVITPVILSGTMILLAFCILYFDEKQPKVKIHLREWTALIVGSIIVITGFCLDYTMFILEEYHFVDVLKISGDAEFMGYLAQYVPRKFNWFIFILGEVVILTGISMFVLRNMKMLKSK